MRPCAPEFNPVCGWKSSEEGKTTDKIFPNVCTMEEENDCDESGESQFSYIQNENQMKFI